MLKEKVSYMEGLPVNILVANIKEYPIHFHADIEVVYVLSGSITLKNGYYTYTLKQGDIFILNDTELHSFENTGEDNMVLLLHLDISYFANYYEDFRNCFFVTDTDNAQDENLEILRQFIARITMEILRKGKNFEQNVIENAHNLIAGLISDFQYFAMEDGKLINETERKGNKILAERLRRITDYMYENYTERLPLSDIANREHLSIFYLSHLIKQATGMSFQELLSFIRVEESEKLLLGTNKKIGMIAEECGFSAIRYYIKHFQIWFGMHPAEYRKKYAGKVIGRETVAKYEKYNSADIEKIIKAQLKDVYTEYVKEIKPKSVIVDVNIVDSMSTKGQKCQFPREEFLKESMKVFAKPFAIFENLHERLIFSNETCLVSTSAKIGAEINSLSILIYNYDGELYKRKTELTGKGALIDGLKAYDDEAEVLIRFVGMSGNFKIIRYKMTRQNFIIAHDEWTKDANSVNKRQALINNFSALPSIEAGKLTVSDALSLRATLYGFSAEIILIDRE